MASNQSQAVAELLNMVFGFIKTMALKCALDLGIADAICNHGQPMTLTQLHSARSLPHSTKLHLCHLLRILTHFGFIHTDAQAGATVDSETTYNLTLTSRLLTNKAEGSLNLLPFVHCQLEANKDMNLKAFLCMGDWFKQDDKEMPFEMAHGCSLWDMAGQNSQLNEMFNGAMASTYSMFSDAIIECGADIFKGVESLVDVGGGTGALAKTIAVNFPHVRCSVLELPQVVQDLPNDGIVKFVPGSMFNYIPPSDAVLLKVRN
jgi:trans-resveratrol di-O-methyltransferase